MMPIWEPPTPPHDDNDMYVEEAHSWYDCDVMADIDLPTVFVNKDVNKRLRNEDLGVPSEHVNQRVLHKFKKDDVIAAPRTMFDRSSIAFKMRRDIRLQQDGKLQISAPNPRNPQVSTKSMDFEALTKWLPHEDWAIVQVITKILKLSINLTLPSPAQTPNWDFCADLVNSNSYNCRTPRHCRLRYESVIAAREEKKDQSDVVPRKAQKKQKGSIAPKNQNHQDLNTLQIYQQDKNEKFAALMCKSFTLLKDLTVKKTPTSKSMFLNTNVSNQKHASVLKDLGILYEEPLTPIRVATNRAERIQREKLKQNVEMQSVRGSPHANHVQQNSKQLPINQPVNTPSVNTANTATVPASSSTVSVATTALTTAIVSNVRGTNQNSNLLSRTLTLQDFQNRATSSQGTVVSLAQLHPSKVAVGNTSHRALHTRPLSAQQMQYLKQQAQKQQLVQSTKVVATSSGETQTIKRLQLTGQSGNGQKLQVASVSASNLSGLSAIQVSQSAGRAQLIKPGTVAISGSANTASTSGLQAKGTRTVTESEVNALLRRPHHIAKNQLQHVRSLVKGSLGLQLSNKGGVNSVGTLQIVQSTPQKQMTMQQFQQVLKQVQPQSIQQGVVSSALISKGATNQLQAQGTGIVQATLSSSPSTKFITGTVGSQPQGIKQTIQVVSGGGSNVSNANSGLRTASTDRSTGIHLQQPNTVRVSNPTVLSAALQNPISVAVRAPNNQVRIQTTPLSHHQTPNTQQNQSQPP